MNKIIAFITSAMMSVSVLASCGSNDDAKKNDDSSTATYVSSKVLLGAGAAVGLGAAVLVPSMIGYVKKSKLRSANSNAKLLFTTITAAMADLAADGDTATIKNCSHGKVLSLEQLDLTNKIDKAVYEVFADTSPECQVYFEIDTDRGYVNIVQWQNGTDPVGQYPSPNTDASRSLTIGTVPETDY